MNSTGSSLSDTLERLYRRTAHGIKPGLDATRRLLTRLQIGPAELTLLHIAGTNGKGSCAAMLESVLRMSGYKTGLFTSPHLIRFHERFRVDGEDISDTDLTQRIETVLQAVEVEEEAHPERPLTFFEITTAIALLHFKMHRVEVAVIETGMGGRLDSTNVMHPILTLITRIGMDHRQWLGDTLPEIAAEKAGILKSGIPAVFADQDDEAMRILRETARPLRAPVRTCEDVQISCMKGADSNKLHVSSGQDDYGTVRLPLAGRFQIENLAAVITSLEVLMDLGFERINRKAVQTGLAAVRWPGRMQLLNADPPVLLDCAHNPDGMTAFFQSIRAEYPKQPVGLVFSCLKDKEVEALCRIAALHADKLWVIELDSPRAVARDDLLDRIQSSTSVDAVPATTLQTALEDAKAWAAARNRIVLICGSLVLAGNCLALQEREHLWTADTPAYPSKKRSQGRVRGD